MAAACGGGGSGAGGPDRPALAVAGDYLVHKIVLSDTCGLGAPGDAFDNPATVRHTAGATAFVLNDHGTRDLPGAVRTDGGFDLQPSSGLVMNTIPARDTFSEGRFNATGFFLRDTTDLDRSPVAGAPAGPCRVVASWTGSKSGPPNVIP
jgi:hypothetical protein